MKIEITWTMGNFRPTAATELEIAEPVNELPLAVLKHGFLNAMQRTPAGNAERAVAGPMFGWKKNDKGEYQRPTGFQRNTIPFSEENAIALAEGFGTSVNIGTTDAPVMLKYAITDVVEHEGSDAGTSRKMATEMAEQVKGNVAMLTVLGCNAESSTETVIEACHKFLGGLRKKGKEATKVITAADDKRVAEKGN